LSVIVRAVVNVVGYERSKLKPVFNLHLVIDWYKNSVIYKLGDVSSFR